MSCPICEKRKPKRFCPAKAEKICAVCCGTEREVTIDCPSDCTYLVAARRYEAEHPQPLSPEEVPHPDVDVSSDLVHERRAVVSGFSYHILKFALENRDVNDADVLAALAALADTFRTLGTGLYYEKLPESATRRGLYELLLHFVEEVRKQESERAGFAILKDSEVFHLLVFLLRVGKRQSTKRPRSRAFLDFLRAQFPRSAELQPEAPRIIVP